MSAGRIFFDTNIWLYWYSDTDPAKRTRARQLAAEHAREIVISTQVVQEFYAAGSRKLAIPRRELEAAVDELMELPVVTLGPAEIRTAIQIERRYQISFWDALIVAAAESGGAEMLFTEDLNDGQRYGGVLVRNPFRL
jgi:predicted nucleic acid-binding protein